MNEVVIVASARTAIGRAGRGSLRQTRPDDLAAHVLRAVLERAGNLDAALVEDVILGCAMPEQEQGANIARIAALRAGLPSSVPAVTVNRFCASGLEAIAIGAQRIAVGQADIVLAGGVESMSLVPFQMPPAKPNPALLDEYPAAYASMGQTGETLALRWQIARGDADAFAYQSHAKALAAIDAGRFRDEIAPLTVALTETDDCGQTQTRRFVFDTDEGPRRQTSPDALAALKPAFGPDGQITAGNASPLSDGAAAVILMRRERAQALGLPSLGRFIGYAVAGVPPEIMGIGPAFAVPKLLAQTGYGVSDLAVIELNEAFASQALAVLRDVPLPLDRVNPNGGAVALGHPLGCTGARQTVTLLHELPRRGGGLGLVTMCVGGGMGAAALFAV